MKTYNTLILFLLFSLVNSSYALVWRDLWQTRDSQAQALMKEGLYKEAQAKFVDESWRAAAAFRAKDYQEAATIYARLNTKTSNYNLGNALAHLGKLPEAISAYKKALAINPNDEDALYNKKILEEMLKKQNQEKNDHKDNDEKENKQQDKQDGGIDKDKQEEKEAKNKDSDLKNQDKLAPEKKEDTNLAKNQETNNQKNQQNQWLRLIPDDPGGLLREKFRRDYLRRRGE